MIPSLQSLIIHDVRAIDPSSSLDSVVDVVITEGRITRIGPGAAQGLGEEMRRVNGRGRWLLPALVEIHAHFREPGFEHKEDIETGLHAAAAGGYAHVCVMPNTRPVNDEPSVSRRMLERATELGGPRLYPVAAITKGLMGQELTDLAAQKVAGAVACSDDGRCVVSSGVMRRALEAAAATGLPLIQHAEDHTLTEGALMHEGEVSRRLGLRGWPRAAEDVIVARDLILLEATRAAYHVAHLSTRGAVKLVRQAKERGLPVTAEVAPHHLLLTHERLESRDAMYKVNPPLREADDVQAVREALAEGVIDCIATDHAPHTQEEKAAGLDRAPPGMIGLQHCLPLMLGLVREGVLSLARMVDALTASPARVVGIESPRLREGAPAELCLVDPEAEEVVEASSIRSRSKNTPFLGSKVRGRVMLVLVGGKVAFARG